MSFRSFAFAASLIACSGASHADRFEIQPEFYFGVSAGYINADIGGAIDPFSGEMDGFVGGLLVGVQTDLQHNFFGGFEFDGVLSTATMNETVGGAVGTAPFTINFRAKQEWLVAARGRFGRTFGKFAPYLTGGLAIGQTAGTSTINFLGVTALDDGDQVNVGLVGGGGLEYAVTDRISIRQEGRFTHLFDKNNLDFQAISGRASIVFKFPN